MKASPPLAVPTSLPPTTLETAQLYRDVLGWAVHPLTSPDDASVPEADRGKRPIFSGWPSWRVEDATDEILGRHFGVDQGFNIGVVVRPPHVVVDLDSHQDGGAAAAAFVKAHPELAQAPRERTAGGFHIHFTCRDLPAFPAKQARNARAAAGEFAKIATPSLAGPR